jgi:hypothetical protein
MSSIQKSKKYTNILEIFEESIYKKFQISTKEIQKNQKWTFLVCPFLKILGIHVKNAVF